MNFVVASLSNINILQITLQLVIALVVILLGFLSARGLEMLTTIVLKTIQIDSVSKLIGLDALLEKGEVKKTLSELLGNLVYWLVSFLVIVSVASYYGLAVEAVLGKLLVYMGIVFIVALVLNVGLFLASLIAGIVKVIMVNLGIAGAKTASRLLYYIVVIFTFLVALGELGIKPDVLVPQIGVIIGAFGLAAAIAFGLGCKDMAADFLHNLFKGK